MTSLPTLKKLGVTLPEKLDASSIAADWLNAFAKHIQAGNVENVLGLLTEDAFVRDMLVLTWHFRTFQGTAEIKRFLEERVANIKFEKGSFKLGSADLQKPYPDLAWIQAMFGFETDIGIASGVFRLVSTSSANGLVWKAHTVYTNLDDLKGFPEQVGHLRDPLPNHGKWADKRAREIEFLDGDPTVLVVGAGQSGLDIGARLKALGVLALIVEKQPRVGDQWRNRYQALCLHDPVWSDHLPYIPFPSTWPVYTPALKLADWMESYAHSLELNVWTSATATHASQDEVTKKWTVTVKRGDGTERKLVVDHLILAPGFGGSVPVIPQFPGQDQFEGQILHSSQHRTATDHAGKKVVVIGACTSGHDIAADYYEHGIDVTMYQRGPTYVMTAKSGMPRLVGTLYFEGGPPTEIADKLGASFPNNLVRLLHKRVTRDIAEEDKELLDGLKRVGFKLTMGPDDAGLLLMVWDRGGGYYIDVGASQLIIDGKIKLKNDSDIAGFTKTGLKFEDGSELSADVVIFSTGYGDARGPLRNLCGDAIADRCTRVWGLNKEGELNGVCRYVGIPNVWFMMGNLALCRFFSKHLALQIKAIQEGIFTTRYVPSESA